MSRMARGKAAFAAALAALALVTMLAAVPASAQQPTSVNPTASSVKEKQLLDALKPEGPSAVAGRVSIPDQRSGSLIQPGGTAWRDFRESRLPLIAGIAILGMTLLVAVFYLVRGTIPIAGGRTGRLIERFSFLDRFGHWLTAVSFIALGLTGLNLSFGRALLRPIIGAHAFASLTHYGKVVHNYGSFAFVTGLALIFLMWVWHNIPHPRDIQWLANGGGLVGKHVEAGRFNAGQKLIFWAVILGGGGLAFTGYNMMFPFQFTDLAGLQTFTIVHALIAFVLTAVIIAHIYIGSLGMEGAFEAMGTGQVDENWAKEHHSLWVEEMKAKRGQAPQPAE